MNNLKSKKKFLKTKSQSFCTNCHNDLNSFNLQFSSVSTLSSSDFKFLHKKYKSLESLSLKKNFLNEEVIILEDNYLLSKDKHNNKLILNSQERAFLGVEKDFAQPITLDNTQKQNCILYLKEIEELLHSDQKFFEKNNEIVNLNFLVANSQKRNELYLKIFSFKEEKKKNEENTLF